MKLSFLFINILIILNALTYSSLAGRIYTDPILVVAKCGYHCWPKYAEEGSEKPTHDMSVSNAVKNLDDYQIGALRGCMEECFIREIDSDVYPPLGEPNYSPWGHSSIDDKMAF